MVNRLERGSTIKLSPQERIDVLKKIPGQSVTQNRERIGPERNMVAAIRTNALGSYSNNFLFNDNEAA